VLAKIPILRDRDHSNPVLSGWPRPDDRHPVRIRHLPWSEEDGIHQGEERGRRANPKCEHENGTEREERPAGEETDCLPHVLPPE
jgi:hypothetical protein